MTSRAFKIRSFLQLFVFSLALPWGCFCGEREEVIAKGWTLELLIERFDRGEKGAVAYDLAHPPSNNWGGDGAYFCMLLDNMGKLGDQAALPFLEEKSLMTNAPGFIRSAAALAYIKIANADEALGLMRKLYGDPSAEGSWRFFANRAFLEKVKAGEKSLTPETREKITSFLLGLVQNAQDSENARDADLFLLDRIPGYADSRQRATLDRYANTGNQWVTNTFNPIKAHFDKIPPSKRVDLRDRFPGLPPLPKETQKADYSVPLTWLGFVLGFLVVGTVAIIFLHKAEKGVKQ